LKTIAPDFITVDLDIKSTRDLNPLLDSWGGRVIRTHLGRSGRRHWMRFVLSRPVNDPTRAIFAFDKLVRRLPKPARQTWNVASTESDVGIQAGFEHGAGEWTFAPRILEVVCDLGATLCLTVYSPLPLLEEEKR
jgi:hypothetical protein